MQKSEEIVLAADFRKDEIDLIRDTVAKGATDLELKLFLYQCKKTGLDPLSRQIHFVKRFNKNLGRDEGTIQTGIDGYRAIADSTGEYAGSDDAIFVEEPNAASNKAFPISATVSVWKMVAGQRCQFTATARWAEYYPGEGVAGFFWRKMPHGQLAKVAEALALRKAFPKPLSGVYTNEEMNQADGVFQGTKEDQQQVAKLKIDELNAKQTEDKITDKFGSNPTVGKSAEEFVKEHTTTQDFISTAQAKRFYAIGKGAGWTDLEMKDYLAKLGIASSKEIPRSRYAQICLDMESGASEKVTPTEIESFY